MSQITIQCRLVSCESTRHQLWKLMAEKNTPLVNELLEQVGQHSDFESWRQKGKLPASYVKSLCESLKTEERFSGQPGRFYTSASALVNYIYKSWLALQQRKQWQLEGLTRWLELLKSDTELATAANWDLDTLRTRAALVLAQAQAQCDPANSQQTQNKKSKQPKKRKINNANRSVSTFLFQAYRDTEDVTERCAIAYLLKNGCKVTEKCEDLEKFTKRRRSVEIRIQRLTEQLASRMPRGRDLTGQRFLESLGYATTSVPKSEASARSWQDSLLKKPKSVPFPVAYETNEDMTWFRNQKGRLCVYFNGQARTYF